MQEIPQFLYKKLQSQYGEELTKKIANGYSKQRYATLRANTIKTEANNVAKELQKAGIKFDKVNWSKGGQQRADPRRRKTGCNENVGDC